jgi:nucleolar MIF4G domain-containing protein 1
MINRLAESNKDSIFRDLVALYNDNSHIVTTSAVVDNILQNLKASTNKISLNCLLYGSLMSALHFGVGIDTTSYFIETIFNSFRSATLELISNHDFNTKFAHNLLTIICSLYDLRILHHQLVVELLHHFSEVSDLFMQSVDISQRSTVQFLRLEFIEVIVHHSGEFLRADNPSLFQHALEKIEASSTKFDGNHDLEFRQRFLLESLVKVRTSPLRPNSFTMAVRASRKWLGGIKNSLSSHKSDAVLNLSLADLLNAETKGRWWKIGASWRTNTITDLPRSPSTQVSAVDVIATKDLVETAATKLKLSGGNKKEIFRVLMNCRDVMDAFESLLRLDLKGKGDRDIIRVLCECCCQEIPYNPFYGEVSKLFCGHSRQAKITYQFVIWDAIKSFRCSENENVMKHIINLARMTAELVVSFNLPLIFLKIFSPVDLMEADISFLTIFFTSLFLADENESRLKEVVDRIATSKDFSTVRDLMLLFLQVSSFVVEIRLEIDQCFSRCITKEK